MYIKRNQRQSILFLSRLYHPHIGGVERHVRILSSLLKKKGHKVTIITERFDDALPLIEVIDGITVHRIGIPKNSYFKKFFVWLWLIKNISILTKADVIHIHDVFYWVLPLRPLILRKKIYITFHGYENFPVKLRWIVGRKIAEAMCRGSICVGNFMKKWYLASPTYVIYGGVRLEVKNNASQKNSAVFFGRLEKQTGIVEYLNAYKIIRKRYPKFRLTVYGEGPLKKIIPKDVICYPFSSNVEDVISSHKFVFVSRYLSMLEALVQKKVVIAVYDNPIKKDYLVDSPFKNYVTIASSSRQIAKDVISQLKGKDESAKISKSYLWAKSQSWENVLITYLKLWKF